MRVKYFPTVESLPFKEVDACFVDEAMAAFWQNYLPEDTHLLLSGERCKTREEKERIEEVLFSLPLTRSSTLGVVGGGASCDLLGFTAATFLRGVDYISVPTTLLAMVDASIGGKTAINVSQGKNLLGAFHPPREVWVAPSFLSTLFDKELFCGYAEMVKLALVYDSDEAEKLLSLDSIRTMPLEHIEKAINGKLAVVQRDLHEHGERKLLNFGHTVGHALECATNFKLAHGEAVWLGMIVEIALSKVLGVMDSSLATEIIGKLKNRAPHLQRPLLAIDDLVPFMLKDKKNKEGQIHSVLLEKSGKACVEGGFTHPLTIKQIEEAWEFLS